MNLIESDSPKIESILTIASTCRRSFNITSFRQSKSLCLTNIDPKLGTSTFGNLTQTLRRRPDSISQLIATLLGRSSRVPSDVAKTQRHAYKNICAVRLSTNRRCGPYHCHWNCKQQQWTHSMFHVFLVVFWESLKEFV